MKKDFSLSNNNAMINFTVKYCQTVEDLLNSNGFRIVLQSFLETCKKKQTRLYKYMVEKTDLTDTTDLINYFIIFFKLMKTMSPADFQEECPRYAPILENRDCLLRIVEEFYNHWRKIERYTVIDSVKATDGFEKSNFIDANTDFTNLILNFYRVLQLKISNEPLLVFRQLPAGCNAGLILSGYDWKKPMGYDKLSKIPFINSIMLNLPFTTYPKMNTRDGYFVETFENPLLNCRIDPNHWFCYPAKVGPLVAYIYFHRDFMSHGISLCNLFQLAELNVPPDIVYVFGARDDNDDVQTLFYDDDENKIMLGYVNYNYKIDYFGYMKKMTLTLHNLIMMKRGNLPIHGAMVKITIKNGKSLNLIIVGDSGTGKSESLEAFRALSEEYIDDMNIIFDDMGTLAFDSDGNIKAYGTEIGAFVRLDDLDPGYAFKEIDRSIFMNPDKINARLVMPVATYKDVVMGQPVDMILYGNNYEEVDDSHPSLERFQNKEDALNVFRKGLRMAKGTTTEKGLVGSYFANPFGPYQKEAECEILLDKYFEELFNKDIFVGQIRTQLGIHGMERKGPLLTAKKLLEMIL
ncbi:MAG: phosphoenolpyruvate carboxykinase [Oscillospiraceae bacterium]|nr:phosphoenolpyruvate carboxykinase [Oscillospiraceae bacterium]